MTRRPDTPAALDSNAAGLINSADAWAAGLAYREDVSTRRLGSLRVLRPDLLDVAVAAIALALSLSTAAFDAADHGEPSLSVAAMTVQGVGGVALLWRRMLPVPVWFVVGLSATVYGLADWPDPLLPFISMVALVSVFEWSTPRVRAMLLAATVAIAAVGTAAVGDSGGLDWWTTAFVVVAAPLAGAYLRTRRELIEELRANNALIEQRRRLEVEEARRSERLHVARELHDVVAHHVTLAVVQAEAAAASADTGSRTVLDAIARTGRDAMTELRHMIGALRDPDDAQQAPVTPAPSLDRVAQLVDGVRANGFDIELVESGIAPAVDAVVDTAAYRVVQESLTNIVKHAPHGRARVLIDRTEAALTIDVENALGDDPASAPGAGIIGLHERVALAGGTISVGPTPGGTFRVHASFPVVGP